ncbi:phosphopantothenate--cysteine ligase [Enterococcus sp. PF1-24]|uniref:phosphopantothenate--cysteine ligase n=1 Tax=unclassified Enterococcus TaxID=2608891 RepID=UPI0024748252|nr:MULTISPECIES: phosphopantothenate--cysteine ligase [unclassified Enterococcus]MDH6363290.1 phosphopantothenate--cysteine ligase [Enterococcus sp. PFB1-1]MDH6400409.1 phosphopantothenate--cysteine ligase [Enterococcus sp. PF1-24]
MRILITAGGTSEAIDQVRAITNHSTGSLGVALAKVALQNEKLEVDYVTTKSALKPTENSRLHLYLIQSTADLSATLNHLLEKNTYDMVIHSMAVSDFTTETAFSEEELITAFLAKKPALTAADLKTFFNHLTAKTQQASKISSDTERLIITLKKTPKVIQQIKKLQPETLLVGFKLLVDVSKEELLSVAEAALIKNQADFVLANDLTEIAGEKHHGYLLAKNGEMQEAHTKAEIADLILQQLEK